MKKDCYDCGEDFEVLEENAHIGEIDVDGEIV